MVIYVVQHKTAFLTLGHHPVWQMAAPRLKRQASAGEHCIAVPFKSRASGVTVETESFAEGGEGGADGLSIIRI